MIKENQKLLNRIQVVLDAGVIIVAYVLSWYIRFRSGLFDLDPWYLSLREYMTVLSGAVLFDPVLRISALHAEAGTGKKAGNLACSTGECDRPDGCDHGIFPCKAFGQIFQMGSIYLLLCQYYHGGIRQKYGEDGFAQGEKERI